MTNKVFHFNILRDLAFIFMLGFLVYHLFPFPPIVWRLGLVGISVLGIIMHMSRYKFTAVEQSMLAFVALVVIHFILSFLWRKPLLTNFGNVLCSMLPVSLFFVLAAKGVITQRSLSVFLILSCIAGYFYFRHAESLLIEQTIFGESGNFTINASTIFLVIIPLLFFVRKKWITIGVSLVIIFFIIFSAKRGNIISMLPPFYLLVRMNMKNNKSFVNWLVLILVVSAFAYLAYYLMTNSDYMMRRIEDTLEGNSSNRDRIYAAAFSTWLNAPNILNMIFGFGTDGTLSQIGIRAHNDWLEILVDYGIIGVIIYGTFFVYLMKAAWRNKNNIQLYYALLSVFVIWFTKSIISMGFTNDIFSFLSIVIGIVLGLGYRQKHGLSVFSE